MDLRIGQEWYFFSRSANFVIYKIERNEYKYSDGELIDSETTIHLRSSNNMTIVKFPQDFHENGCKLIKDVEIEVLTHDIKTISVPIKNRLDTVE